MDMMKFYDITHREHVVCNPSSEAKLDRVVALLRLSPGAQVVDIACGKGEFLIRMAGVHTVHGVGIDISPFHIDEANRRLSERVAGSGIVFTVMDGAGYRPDEPHSLEVASCIGASWVFGGHAATLDTLSAMVKPGGWVIVGEPFWRQEPSPEYLAALSLSREDFGTHFSNAEAGAARGLDLVYTVVSSEEEWDRYEGLQWFATHEYVRHHPDDPDVHALQSRVQKEKEAYLRWGRETLGWAIYMFRSRAAH